MVRQQLVIGAALLAGAAIGFCLAPEEKNRKVEGETESPAKAMIADRGDEASVAALRARVKALEAELAKARAQAPIADMSAVNAQEREEVAVRDEGQRNGAERFRAEMERLKNEEPERYREIVANIENFRRRAAERRQAKIDYLSSIDTAGMSEKAKAVHETLKAALARRTAIDAELGAEDLSDERREELMGQMRDAERQIRRLNRAERANLLGTIAAAVGMEGDAATEFVEAVGDVIKATDSGFGGHHGPPPPPPPGN